jgi:predicted dehydrogenase
MSLKVTFLMTRTLIAVFLLLVPLATLGFGPRPDPASAAVQPSTPAVLHESGPLRIAIIGMVHGHVEGLLWQASQRSDIKIVGVYEPDRALFDRLAGKYKLDPALYHASLAEMLDTTKPEAASVMGSIKDHLAAVEACAPRGIHTLLEKPLAFSIADARRMAALAKEHGVLVLTNYETSWYASLREAKRLVDSGEMAPVRRMIFRHGHKGPQEIGCSLEFLAWLTDPAQNGGGALVDFGCYGAVLSTWLMDGQRPTRVTAAASTLKPSVYPRVDDDATIVLTYPTATAVIQASWAWTHDNKEMDVHTEKGSIHAGRWDDLQVRTPDQPAKTVKPAAKPPEMENEWVYLRKVVRGECAVDDLSGLEFNLIVVEILDAARAQVATATSKTAQTPAK